MKIRDVGNAIECCWSVMGLVVKRILWNLRPRDPEKPDTRRLVQPVKLGPRPAMVNWMVLGHEVKMMTVVCMN